MTQNPQDPNDPRAIARKKRQTAALKANMKRRKEAAKDEGAESQPLTTERRISEKEHNALAAESHNPR